VVALLGVVLFLSGCSWLSFLSKPINWREQAKPYLSGLGNWATYYGSYYNQSVVNQLNQYDLVVLGWMDRSQSIPKKSIVLQYLAIVEAGPTHRQYYDWLKNIDESYRLFDNPDYPGAWVIDIRKPEWQDLIVNQAIPWTMDHGGQGLMLDTFGNISLYLGNALEYRQAAANLVRRIRQTYPNLVLLINEPGDLLLDIYQYIDGIIFEQYLADIRTGELFCQPRSSWGSGDIIQAKQLRRQIQPNRNWLIMSCDMVCGDEDSLATRCLTAALSDTVLPTLTPFSSLANRYQKLSANYLRLLKNL